MRISNRLKSVAGLVINSDHVIDIGCDHALLDVFLVKNGVLKKVLVSDVNQNALDNGIKNIKKYHMTKEIIPRLGYGLEVIDDETDTAIISGMGANTIIKILSNSKLKQIKKLIIQSNNDYYLLRKFLCIKGFYIAHESVIYENGKYYINIVFLRGTKKYTIKELKYGPILMYANKDYYNFLLKKQEQILDNIPKYKIFARIKHRKDQIYLKRLTRKDV